MQPTTSKKKKLYRRDEVPEYLKEHWGLDYAIATLGVMAVKGDGPLYYQSGRLALYPPASLDEWAIKKLGPLRRSSSDNQAA